MRSLAFTCALLVILAGMSGCATRRKAVVTPAATPKCELSPPPPEIPILDGEPHPLFSLIMFATNSAELSESSIRSLQEYLALLLKYPGDTAVIEGHTDDTGSDAYNEVLGLRRANAVRDYLILKGIAPERLKAVSFGESQPLRIHDSESMKLRDIRWCNRCVKIRFTIGE